MPDAWKQQWFMRIQDLIDNYQPDLLYTDGGIPFEEYGLPARLALLQHSGTRKGLSTPARLRKDCETGTCALDIERGVPNDILNDPVADRHLHRRLALQART